MIFVLNVNQIENKLFHFVIVWMDLLKLMVSVLTNACRRKYFLTKFVRNVVVKLKIVKAVSLIQKI